ncbi:MAG: hypothetical protein WA954_12405 [Parerythrobacter sp.]
MIAMTAKTVLAAAALFALAACSEQTQDNTAETLDRAIADTEENAEVVENAVREGAIDAADSVSDGAEALSQELSEDERVDPDQGDGILDGTD